MSFSVIRKFFPRALVAGICVIAAVRTGYALGQTRYITETRAAGAFPIVSARIAANIYVDSNDWFGVVRAAGDLQSDINKVTGVSANIVHDGKGLGASVIIIGTIGKSPLIDQLIREKKIDVTGVTGKWEAFDIQVVSKPLPGVSDALVIAGSDKRGTIYGIYDVSEEIGVSPWYSWADVPVNHKDNLFVKPGRYMEGESAVKYRGIFFNDEAPALDGWVKEKFGMWPNPEKLTRGATNVANMNHEFYGKVFELVLRLKGNFMWPAMWNNAFNEDDPLNGKTADDYGVVMGTSHHEPMLRAQKEWTRHGVGVWDYSKNADVLKDFWSGGVKRNKDFESLTTIGMRGDGDLPMGGPNMDVNIKLLEQVVADQRKLLAENVNPDVTKVPQVWALYKEVQGYYEKGMRVPDDVTLLWCDDNWGDIRRLPTPDERKRAGGAGIYYHFDYVGGPRNYKWIDTNPIPKVWEQMNLALQYGADRLWVVNVGDLKPVEFPTEYFLALGRDPKRWTKDKINEFTRLWAEREFGAAHAGEIADMVSTTLKYNGRRKPELLDSESYSLTDYQEADRTVADFKALVEKAEKMQASLPEAVRPAFFELVLHPAKSYEQVLELYIDTAKAKLYGTQERASTNDYVAKVKALFQADADLGDYYNHTLLNGKWNHMMDQTHIGYTSWQQPMDNKNHMPAVKEIELPDGAAMGVAVEGSTSAWPGTTGDATLPGFDSLSQEKHYIDVFDKGKAPFDFTAKASAPWIVLSATKGTVDKEHRLWVNIDWNKAPRETSEGAVRISRAGGEDVTVKLQTSNPQALTRASLKGFVETNGYVSIEAEHYARKTDAGSVHWDKIEDYGRTLSGMSVFPVTAPSMTPKDSPCLEYQMYLFSTGKAEIDAITSPTLNFVPGRGLRFAIAFDDQQPQIVDAVGPLAGRDNLPRDWETIVKDAARHVKATLDVPSAGYHTLKIWMVDPAIVVEKIVVNMGGLKPSYLGPPESYHAALTK